MENVFTDFLEKIVAHVGNPVIVLWNNIMYVKPYISKNIKNECYNC